MRKNLTFLLLLASTAILFLFSCRGDEILDEKEERPIDLFETFYETDLSGRVIDERGMAVSNALVTARSAQTTTDEFGYFDLGSIDAPSSGLYIEVEADGFHQSGSQFVPNSINQTLRLIILPEKEIERFNANEGISILTFQGSQLIIPPDAIARNDQPFDGEVFISIREFDPNSQQESRLMPANLVGEFEDNSIFIDGAIAFAVSMTDGSGAKLNLRSESTATITFQSNENISNATEFWHFNNATGKWDMAGEVSPQGDRYVLEAEHFSWYCVGSPLGNISKICIDLVDINGTPFSGDLICLSTDNDEFFSCDIPFDNETCHLVPNDLPITINIWNSCNELFHTEVLGMFNLGLEMAENITVTVPIDQQDQEVQISGQIVDCNNNPVQNGAVAIQFGIAQRLAVELDQGNYDLTIRQCKSLSSLDLIAYDLDNKLSAQLEIEVSDNTEFLDQDIVVCDTPIESIFTLSSPNNQVILNNCVDFLGNLISSASTSEAMKGVRDGSNITIDEYGSTGSFITGSFSEGDITGQFIAQRIR